MLSSKLVIFTTVLLFCLAGTEADTKCTINFGFCQDTKNSCSGTYLTYLCNGPVNRKCCVPAFEDTACHARGGKCQGTTVTCFGGQYYTGLCDGPRNRRCCISNATDSAYNDEKCQKIGGKCQYTDITCVNGIYVSGQCGGPTNRRCCLRHVTENTPPACGSKRQRMACELFNSSLVLSAGSQGASATSPDTPYANLRDMCEGRQAIRSKKRCNFRCPDTSRFVCLHEKVLQYLVNLKNRGRIVIEELTAGCHPGDCKHQWGRAVDLHRDYRVIDYIGECLRMGGAAWPHAQILHCDFRQE